MKLNIFFWIGHLDGHIDTMIVKETGNAQREKIY